MNDSVHAEAPSGAQDGRMVEVDGQRADGSSPRRECSPNRSRDERSQEQEKKKKKKKKKKKLKRRINESDNVCLEKPSGIVGVQASSGNERVAGNDAHGGAENDSSLSGTPNSKANEPKFEHDGCKSRVSSANEPANTIEFCKPAAPTSSKKVLANDSMVNESCESKVSKFSKIEVATVESDCQSSESKGPNRYDNEGVNDGWEHDFQNTSDGRGHDIRNMSDGWAHDLRNMSDGWANDLRNMSERREHDLRNMSDGREHDLRPRGEPSPNENELENVNKLSKDVSTQTCTEYAQLDESDQEVFHETPGIEELMSAMEVEEFIPWFEKDKGDDNKSDTSEIPEPEDFRDNHWSYANSQGIKLGKYGCYYEGAIDNKRMHGYGRLILRDRDQFIEGKWDCNRLIELNFAQLTHDFRKQTIFIVKQKKNSHLITIFEEDFVARATCSSFKDLALSAQIATIKSSLFQNFTIIDIIQDEIRSKRDAVFWKFESILKETASSDADPVNRAAVLILLSRNSQQRDAGKVLSAIERDKCVSEPLRMAAKDLLAMENALLHRKLDMFKMSLELQEQRYLDLRGTIFKIYSQRIAEHRRMLVNKCPNSLLSMLSAIESLPAEKILYITKDDVGIFEHLLSLSGSERYFDFVDWVFEGLKNKIRKIESHTPPNQVIPLMFPVYGFIFKSFLEITSEICSVCNSHTAGMVKQSGGWRLQEKIKWPDDEEVFTTKQKLKKFFKMSKSKLTLHRKSLEIQYRFIYDLLMNFSPDKYDKTQKYAYDFRVLETDKTSSWWQKGIKFIQEAVGWVERLKDSPDERLVWLFILDHTVHELFKDGSVHNALDIVDLYSPLLKGHMSFVAKAKSSSYESFRVLTHSILRFIVSTAPYFREAQEKPGVDNEILSLQMATITKASEEMDKNPSAFVSFKDLIAEYNRYWGLRLFVNVANASGHFSARINEVMQKSMNIVTASLKKSVCIPTLVDYIRSLNDFFDDFKDIDFNSQWFVKSDFYDSGVMEKVSNKLSGKNCSYRVVEMEKYVHVLEKRSSSIPEHYIILIVFELLQCIQDCLQSSSRHGEAAPETEIQSTRMLVDAIRRSLMYLKDQPDYVDFETFKKESIEPFKSIVSEHLARNMSLSEFKKRTDIIRESFYYIRKMDELGIEQALAKLKSVNSCYISDGLLDCYNLYLSHYNGYLAQYKSQISEGRSHMESVRAVRRSIAHPRALHFTEWTEEFKTKEIPQILAGLSAVWSILVSKDVSSTGKFLKPHCIQILCVMRLLSVKQSKTNNHLAQVLTGQGKSVILGLLSSTLALTGHKVRVLCYSEYLSSRDQNDFKEFFKMFNVDVDIVYGTFENMANGFLLPKCNGVKTSLRQLVEDRVLSRNEASLGSVATETKDTVLLIDEVDVFFTDEFYGNVYDSCTSPAIPGLTFIQEKMWSIAKGSKYEADEVLRLTEKFIEDEVKSGNLPCREFNAFKYKNRPRLLTLLEDNKDGNLQVKEYTNRTLMEEHLHKMAKEALLVGNAKGDEWFVEKFKLNDNGRICKRNNAGKFVTYSFSGYLNTFNYFRLKGSNFDSKGFQNYGYILLDTGKISYARLPSQFKLILGVSGTLKDLSEHEMKGIRSYSIDDFSILPSFFGESNLKPFDENSDFLCVDTEQNWLKTIYDKANQTVKSFRAVLIFFDTERRLDVFSKEYKMKFDRFNEITENTGESERVREAYVNEAGLSCAVTLATRGMGRGVDYKSSLAVEKNGGIHVIQTFYSVDVKEEIQIKGRTARKDNKGSYELVLCKEHLIEKRIIDCGDSGSISYSRLNERRTELMNKKGESVSENIKKSERNHKITMDYYGLS